MTNDRDIKDICSTLRQTSLHAAADLIEQLQRERDEARDRLAEAERDADIREDFAYDYGHDEGFRAGIEAAASRMWDIGCDETHVDDIRALAAQEDKPAAPSVADRMAMALSYLCDPEAGEQDRMLARMDGMRAMDEYRKETGHDE